MQVFLSFVFLPSPFYLSLDPIQGTSTPHKIFFNFSKDIGSKYLQGRGIYLNLSSILCGGREGACFLFSYPNLSSYFVYDTMQIGGSGVLVSPLTYIFDEEPPRWSRLLGKLSL